VNLSRTPQSMRIAALLVLLEAAGLLVFAVAELFAIDADRLALGLTNTFFFSLYAVGLAFCAWGFATLRTWSRSLIVMAQVIQLGVAYSFAGGSTTWVSVVLAVVAVAVLMVVFAPGTTQALYGERDDSTTESDQTG
jgi:peptidoglycan/LPS O-acetylase OafA/YrhL